MLNELHKLSETLDNNNIKQREWHYKYETSRSRFRIWLAADGTVTNIEPVDRTLAALCRKYGDNQSSFPAFNIAALYRVTSGENKKYLDSLAKNKTAYDGAKLKALCSSDNWSINLRKKIDRCLRETIPKMPEDSAVSELMRIANRLGNDTFRASLESCIWNRLREDIPAYLPLLVHKGNEGKEPEDDSGSLSIILDLSDWERYGNPIASEAAIEQINEWLMADGDVTTPLPTKPKRRTNRQPRTSSPRLDAFGDPYGYDVNESMPSVGLAPGFKVGLRSMFAEQVCQYRYGNADDASFPITLKRRGKLKTSLEWIAQAENEGVMWRKIDNDAMIFVYPDRLPEIPLTFASILRGDETKIKNVTEVRFKDAAKSFIKTLRAIEYSKRPSNIMIFALQQIPPALSKRAKVVLTRGLTVHRLIQAAREWQRGCVNLPDNMNFDTRTPFPLDMSKIVNKVWKRDGTRADGKNFVKVMRYYEGMELLLDRCQPSWIMRIAHGVTLNSLYLVLSVANQSPRVKKKIEAAQKEEIEYLLPLLGLLLFKSGIEKEVYMRETAYLVGQLLKISDGLHELYCEIKRGGDIPPQLAGNSVFVTATETPVQALALLCARMNPYIAWAKQYSRQKQENSGLAGWHLRQYEMLTPKLKEKLTSNIRFGDLEKAQLFIGYLAMLPKSDKEESSKQEDAKNG